MAEYDQIISIFKEYDNIPADAPFADRESFLKSAAEKYADSSPDDFLGISAIHSELGGLYRSTGNYLKSEESFLKAKNLLESNDITAGANYATVLNNLAGLYRLTKDYDKSLEMFDKAIALYEENGTAAPDVYASSLNNKGLLCQDLGRFEEAEKLYLRALELVKPLNNNGFLVATTYGNLAFVRYASGNVTAALDYMDRALELYKEVLGEDNPMYKQCLFVRGKMAETK